MQVGGKQRGRGGPTHESAKESGGTRVSPRLTSSAQTVRNSKREGWVGEEEGKKKNICRRAGSGDSAYEPNGEVTLTVSESRLMHHI